MTEWQRLVCLIATGMGVGKMPAPGTFGTALAVLPAVALNLLPLYWQLVILAALIPLSVWLCDIAATAMDAKDPDAIVLDEVVGFLAACIALPPGLWWLVVAFVLFRLLDILKPGPIGQLDKSLSGGLGIVLDDLAAGLLCWLVLQGSYRLLLLVLP